MPSPMFAPAKPRRSPTLPTRPVRLGSRSGRCTACRLPTRICVTSPEKSALAARRCCGSKMFETRVATETSNTVERLTTAGMIPLGKTHMVEFAFGAWGTNPLMGAPWNPWDLKTHRAPGGSSSGTGVAVAARLAPVGVGSDTGGSVRIPSAFNGLVGLKVTFGRIGLSGTILLSWTLDSIGPMARCVEDCAMMLNALAAPDAREPTTFVQPLEDFTLATRPGSIEGMRIAMPDTRQLPNFMHADVIKAWQGAARTFESLGPAVEAVRLPGLVLRLVANCRARSSPPKPTRYIATTLRMRARRSARAYARGRRWPRGCCPVPMPRKSAPWQGAGKSSPNGSGPTMRSCCRRSPCRRFRWPRWTRPRPSRVTTRQRARPMQSCHALRPVRRIASWHLDHRFHETGLMHGIHLASEAL
ncbi:MAG: hypothetical protein GEV13_36540 [Rhodospirillales bacterium]|nr:hypothetical protein [Rhodospirillales bacterium]